ncbi:MAG: gamma-glutamyltranspeptidase [Gemmatales bacterium]|nr:MAG: gamma-glutamyltranspeptidase [Gemmatales bacterium]
MRGMISAPQPIAVEEGARILANGGNAFDAALACAFMQFVVDPHSCGVGGYLVLVCRPAGGSSSQLVIDAPALAGSKVTPTMWEDRVIGPNPGGWGYFLKDQVNEAGYSSICTPGMMRGMDWIYKRWCTRPWSELTAGAIRAAEEGWVVSHHLGTRWKEAPLYYEGMSMAQKLKVTPSASSIYLKKDGSTYEPGETIVNRDYGQTLRRITEHGPEDFHTGGLARDIAADLEAHDSYVTAEDLAEYDVREEKPVLTSYRGYTIQTASPPHGGPTLAAILNILEGYDLSSMRHNSAEYILVLANAMKAAFADRNKYLGDMRFVDVPLEWMTSKERAEEWRDHIRAGKEIDTARVQPGSPTTTHVSVVDSDGNCVSLTHSLGSSSGVITPGLGFMYNNSMVNFHPYAGHPNSLAPRKSRTTGMTPTIVYRNEKPILVIGAPGATRIITSIAQVIINFLDFGMSITDAVLAPRFDCQGDTIYCQARIPEFVCEAIRKKHRAHRLVQSHGGLALVHAIAIDHKTGAMKGAADTGADGMALEV